MESPSVNAFVHLENARCALARGVQELTRFQGVWFQAGWGNGRFKMQETASKAVSVDAR
jgi:hypothetical protein